MTPLAIPGLAFRRGAGRVRCWGRAGPGPASSPLNRSIWAAACAPRGSAPALRSLRSAPRPGLPRWPLPVRSRSRRDLLARLPRPGPSDPVLSRRAGPAGELRGRPWRTFSAQVRARPGPHSCGRGRLAAASRPGPGMVGGRPRRAQTLGEAPGRGGLGRAYESRSSSRRSANPLPGARD